MTLRTKNKEIKYSFHQKKSDCKKRKNDSSLLLNPDDDLEERQHELRVLFSNYRHHKNP